MQSARIWGIAVLFFATAAAAQESALDPAKATVKASPNDPQASLALGRALRRAGHYPEALAELRRGAALVAGRQPTQSIEFHWEIARTFIGQRDFSQAMVTCKVVGAQTGGGPAGHACAAEAHLLWRRGTEALLETAQALAGNNKSYEGKLSEARAYALQLDDSKADPAFKEAITWKPDDPTGHMYYGRYLVDSNKRDAGIAELKKALELDPKSPDISFELGRVYAQNPNNDAATALENATKERPTFTEAWGKLAEVYLALNRNADAKKAAEAGLKGPADAGLHVVLGRVAVREGRNDDALAEAKLATGIMANSAPAKLLTADAYAAKNEIDLALENYQAAYGFDHLDPANLVNPALACLKAGRMTSARAFAIKATAEFATWGPAWAALGDVLAADKDNAGAKAAYDKALAGKGLPDASVIKAKIAALK